MNATDRLSTPGMRWTLLPSIHGAFQVATNFYQSQDPGGENAYGAGKACTRFEIANEMLAGTKRVGVEEARQILNAVHAEGKSSTLYSNIYDLDDRVVYVYSFHDFGHGVLRGDTHDGL